VSFKGNLSVAFTNPCREPPFYGGVELYFVNNPQIDYDMTGVTNIADAPGIRKIIRNVIWSEINRNLVVPSRIAIDFLDHDDFDLADVQFPPPIGVVRFTLNSAKNLKAMDTGFLQSGKSDPYVVVTLGGGKWTSEKKWKTLDPVWDQKNQCDFSIHDERQLLHVTVWDEDRTSFNDEIGSGMMALDGLDKGDGITQQEIPLTLQGEGTSESTGSVMVGVEWLSLETERPAHPCSECGAPSDAPAKMYFSAKVIKLSGMETRVKDFTAPFTVTLKSSNGEVTLKTLPSTGAQMQNASMVFPPQKIICEKLHAKKMQPEDIAAVVDMDVATVQHICDKADGKTTADAAFEKLRQTRAAMHPQFFQVLEAWMTKWQSGSVELEVHDKRKKLVGKTRAIEFQEILRSLNMEVNGPFKVTPAISLHGRIRMRWLKPETEPN